MGKNLYTNSSKGTKWKNFPPCCILILGYLLPIDEWKVPSDLKKLHAYISIHSVSLIIYKVNNNIMSIKFSLVAQSCPTLCNPKTVAPLAPCSSQTPGACSNSCPSSPTISSSVTPFSSHFQSFPASESFPRNQFFASGGQSIGVSASVSVLPMNIRDWFPLGWIGWISLQSKGLSRVYTNTIVQEHQFFSAQLSL